MIIVTGGAGFIGSRIIKKLNDEGEFNILMVDDLTDSSKIANIKDLVVRDYIDKDDFLPMFQKLAELYQITAVYHMGAESSTTCDDGKYLMKNNYQYTCTIADICHSHEVPLLYASSASVYGDSNIFDSEFDNYKPNNMYGFSKLQADRYIRPLIADAKIIGLRLFNVYSDGEFETHKKNMKSPKAWMKDQLDETGKIKLFEGSDEFERDFIHVNTVVQDMIELQNSDIRGIWNMGTGIAKSFVDVALTMTDESNIEYIKMPEDIKNGYQAYTCADMSKYPLKYNKLSRIQEGNKRFKHMRELQKDEK